MTPEERIRMSQAAQIPWEHPVYARTDGQSPKSKWEYDCVTVAKKYFSAADTIERLQRELKQASSICDHHREYQFEVLNENERLQRSYQELERENAALRQSIELCSGSCRLPDGSR